jgi:hypothetical protein
MNLSDRRLQYLEFAKKTPSLVTITSQNRKLVLRSALKGDNRQDIKKQERKDFKEKMENAQKKTPTGRL